MYSRVYIPPGPGPHPVLMLLHGWTGDENSMWVFSSHLPQDHIMVAPRGLYSSPLGGYSWQPNSQRKWPEIDDFRPAIEALLIVQDQNQIATGDFSKISLVGFSQGAALVYTFALLLPERVHAFAGLSGFLPGDFESYSHKKPLLGKRAFVAHGSQDTLVPVERARQAVALLEQVGARVTYCEDNVQHKLSTTCYRGLEEFFPKHV